ncbi:TetR/AcrR family transcriptional regulator [Paenibacillus arenilitoris]|uniref:TetR/AcrR family transcriptional regulator n=1 Tax=Paenibacillus arenilitoris TaxID=2772299 RepID=A0A927CRM3_9BACL|nr:TetR/AcrR family transcriptional regulator [Paenibacillus arenilitoris]MBD2870656.1 TetR/AcrR family transcriptional regulator [Paenibacillus arenilitoris]
MTIPDGGRTKQDLSNVILNTANHLFEEHGIESVSMHQIAKAAGIGQGTLYRRYANKGDLCMDMMKENFGAFIKQIDDYLTAEPQPPVYDRLCEVMKQVIAFIDKKSQWFGVLHAHIKVDEKKSDFFQAPPYLYLHATLSGLLREAADEGLIPDIDPGYTAHAFIAVHSPHTLRHLRDTMGLTREEIQRCFCGTFIDPLFR